MYILPNKKPIKIDKLEKAFRSSGIKRKFYLNAETGDIASASLIKGKNKSSRYFEIPKVSIGKKLFWMNEFVDDMLRVDNPELAYKLEKALKEKAPAKKFMHILSVDKSGWIHGWSQWESDFLWDEIVEWFCSLPIDIEDDMSELDDDCPLCRMIKEGENDMEKLKKGFDQINTKQKVDELFKQFRENKN